MNYKLNISYVGTNFKGWQLQPDERTVQGEIENALFKVFDQKINLIGSGRTDSGVHAFSQIANFKIETKIEQEKIKKAINSHLKNDIIINSCQIISEDFHSRFSAIEREYIYYITKVYCPFKRKHEWCLKWNIDDDDLVKCSKIILGKNDFGNFCKAQSKKEDNQCNILISKWEFQENRLFYRIKANRFIHHMVRLLVGTMIEVARGKMKFSNFKLLLKNDTTNFNPVKAPAHGLFLNKIKY